MTPIIIIYSNFREMIAQKFGVEVGRNRSDTNDIFEVREAQ